MRLLEGEALRSGEGELHALLGVIGLSPAEFCRMVGIHPSTFYRWYGTPLHQWPVEFLRSYAWATAMAGELRKRGIDPAQFEPRLPGRRMPTGRYPRRKGDLVLERAKQEPGDYSPWTAPRERN
jgi:hypothetical protein